MGIIVLLPCAPAYISGLQACMISCHLQFAGKDAVQIRALLWQSFFVLRRHTPSTARTRAEESQRCMVAFTILAGIGVQTWQSQGSLPTYAIDVSQIRVVVLPPGSF